MSLQSIINSATAIEINRTKLVAQSVSRSGRILTAARNWSNPWRFTIVPRPVWQWDATTRAIFEDVINGDRNTVYTVNFGVSGQSWVNQYLGNHTLSSNQLSGVTVSSVSGNSMTLNVSSVTNGVYVLRKGDVIQPVGHRYVYTVANDPGPKSASTMTITLNRGYITDGVGAGAGVKVGAGCDYRVLVTNMPTMRFINKDLVEFTGEFTLIEEIL